MSYRTENAPTFRDSGAFADWKPPRADYLERLARRGLDGLNWYETARAELETVSKLENWNAERFAAIVAITSPRVSVRRNLRNALNYCAGGALFANTLGNVRRAVETYETGGGIGGQKVSAFYQALRGDENAIVLDVWIARALRVQQSAFSRAIVRFRARAAVRRTAERLETTPARAQAAIWFGAKRAADRFNRPEPFPVLCEYANFLRYGRRFPETGEITRRN